MAVQCPRCRRQYDVTLFQFRHHIRCVCGARLDLERGHATETAAPPPPRLILVCAAEARVGADALGALTERGRRQAAALAERFQDEDVAAVYAGQAPACGETGEALAEGLGLPLEVTALLDEGSADRVLAFLRALARWRPEAATLVVAEAAVCRQALARVLGTQAGTGEPAEAPPASVHVVVAEAAGWRVAAVDDTAHLAARERGS
jgi:broad specificity phosphatase PhoE